MMSTSSYEIDSGSGEDERELEEEKYPYRRLEVYYENLVEKVEATQRHLDTIDDKHKYLEHVLRSLQSEDQKLSKLLSESKKEELYAKEKEREISNEFARITDARRHSEPGTLLKRSLQIGQELFEQLLRDFKIAEDSFLTLQNEHGHINSRMAAKVEERNQLEQRVLQLQLDCEAEMEQKRIIYDETKKYEIKGESLEAQIRMLTEWKENLENQVLSVRTAIGAAKGDLQKKADIFADLPKEPTPSQKQPAEVRDSTADAPEGSLALAAPKEMRQVPPVEMPAPEPVKDLVKPSEVLESTKESRKHRKKKEEKKQKSKSARKLVKNKVAEPEVFKKPTRSSAEASTQQSEVDQPVARGGSDEDRPLRKDELSLDVLSETSSTARQSTCHVCGGVDCDPVFGHQTLTVIPKEPKPVQQVNMSESISSDCIAMYSPANTPMSGVSPANSVMGSFSATSLSSGSGAPESVPASPSVQPSATTAPVKPPTILNPRHSDEVVIDVISPEMSRAAASPAFHKAPLSDTDSVVSELCRRFKGLEKEDDTISISDRSGRSPVTRSTSNTSASSAASSVSNSSMCTVKTSASNVSVASVNSDRSISDTTVTDVTFPKQEPKRVEAVKNKESTQPPPRERARVENSRSNKHFADMKKLGLEVWHEVLPEEITQSHEDETQPDEGKDESKR